MTSKDKSIIRLNPNPEGFGETPDTLDAEDFSSELPLQNTHSVFEDDDIGRASDLSLTRFLNYLQHPTANRSGMPPF